MVGFTRWGSAVFPQEEKIAFYRGTKKFRRKNVNLLMPTRSRSACELAWTYAAWPWMYSASKVIRSTRDNIFRYLSGWAQNRIIALLCLSERNNNKQKHNTYLAYKMIEVQQIAKKFPILLPLAADLLKINYFVDCRSNPAMFFGNKRDSVFN